MRLREFKLRKIILGVRIDAFSSHLPRPGQSCSQLWGSCGGVWKPPDTIYSQYNRQCNEHNTTLHARILFLLFLIFAPSTSLSLLFILFFFNPSSFLIFFFFFLFTSFLISFLITKLKNAIHILIQLIQCGTSSH